MTFSRIGEFGGIEQQGDSQDMFEVDDKFNLRYIAVETLPQIGAVDDGLTGEHHHGHQRDCTLRDSADYEGDVEIGKNKIPTKIYSSQTAAIQPPAAIMEIGENENPTET